MMHMQENADDVDNAGKDHLAVLPTADLQEQYPLDGQDQRQSL